MIGLEQGLGHGLMDAALRMVQARAGLVFAGPRRGQFTAGIQSCMRRAGISDLAEYLRLLATSPELFDDLAAEITVGESYFLRDAAQWELLRTRLLPGLLARTDGTLRIWSAGCASGEEPYSLALVLDHLGAADRARVLGTDLSRAALARAARGLYGPWALRDLPEDLRGRYFRQHGRQLEFLPGLRRRVELRHLNLAADDWPRPGDGLRLQDLILCRNVLIYLDAATVARVAARLLDCLADGGYLMLGASDPIISGLVPCEVELTDAGLLYRRRAAARGGGEWVQGSFIRTPAPRPPSPPAPPAAASQGEAPLEAARARYGQRDYAGAAEVARAALERGESGSALAVLLVRALANQGKLTEAGLACAAALDLHRSDAELVFLHAVLLAQGGHHRAAADALRRALYLDRRLIVAHLALGDALARGDDHEGALRAFRTAERLLAELPGDRVVPASDGEPAARLVEIARARIRLLEQPAA